jgi:nucleotide-binding universal stress UspA family protein
MSGDKAARRVLVGYDGSEEASRALEFAIGLAGEGSLEIHLAYVVQAPPGMFAPVLDEVMDSIRAAGEETLASGARHARNSLTKPITHLESGNPGDALLRLAESLKPDLVVLGATRHSMSERLLGTVSSTFLKARKYPLLVVP